MNLYILRHGIAAEQGDPAYPRDSDRPLTADGERKMWSIAKALQKMELCFDLILSSPYVRARQTAEIVAEALKLKKRLQFNEELQPGNDPEELIQDLKTMEGKAQSILLVGHEPFLSEFVSLLVSGGLKCSLVLKKGGLCMLEAEKLKHGPCASLQWLLTPRQMRLMA